VRVDDPDAAEDERVTTIGLSCGLIPDCRVVAVRLTSPAKPFRPANWIVVVPEDPAWMVMRVEVDEIVKSVTETVTGIECDSVPLFPVRVTVYVPTRDPCAKIVRLVVRDAPGPRLMGD